MYGQKFGIHLYAQNLIEGLLRQAPDQAFTVYCRKEVPEQFSAVGHPDTRFEVSPLASRKLTEQFWLARRLHRESCDLFHATFGRPLRCKPAMVITVHDLFHLRYPERYRRQDRLYTRVAVRSRLERAAAVIAVSQTTRQDVIELLGIEPQRVHAVPLGVDHGRFTPEPEADVHGAMVERFGLPERYLLHVGGFRPIKNTDRIVGAFAEIAQSPGMSDVKMVFAGKKAGGYAVLAERVAELGLQDRVVFTDFFPGAFLAQLYRSAIGLVYPSLIEGFGLPILEAYACGTPVITSDRSAMKEVAGDAGQLVDPEDVSALANAMRRLVERRSADPVPCRACLDRAGQFHWSTTARQTLDVYRWALEGRS